MSKEVELLTDPRKFIAMCWPQAVIYDKQIEIIESVRDNFETIVVAGNQLGKDWISGLITLWFFCSRSPCRIVTSSSGQTQLESVLWGEIKNFIRDSQYPLPINMTHLHIRQLLPDGTEEPKSYVKGIVTNTVENMQGHHLPRGPNGEPRTLCIMDEASGIGQEFYDAIQTWAHRILIVGNPLPCTNFFFTGVKAGDLAAPQGMII